MVLDIDAFRAEKGGNPDKVKVKIRMKILEMSLKWSPKKRKLCMTAGTDQVLYFQVRENQRKRFKDVSMVDKVLDSDEKWRKGETNLVFTSY